jgi:hypothetical protein
VGYDVFYALRELSLMDRSSKLLREEVVYLNALNDIAGHLILRAV